MLSNFSAGILFFSIGSPKTSIPQRVRMSPLRAGLNPIPPTRYQVVLCSSKGVAAARANLQQRILGHIRPIFIEVLVVGLGPQTLRGTPQKLACLIYFYFPPPFRAWDSAALSHDSQGNDGTYAHLVERPFQPAFPAESTFSYRTAPYNVTSECDLVSIRETRGAAAPITT